MAEQLFSTGLGFAIEKDDQATSQWERIITEGVPGDAGLTVAELAFSDNAPLGSKATDTLTGLEYRKHTVGAGTSTWVQMSDANSAGSDSWRDPALVKDDTVYANIAAAELAVNTGSIDGVALSDTDRILFTNITGVTDNVYIISGTPGAGATLVEDTNLATNNDALIIDDGSFAGIQYNYSDLTSTWVKSNQTSLDELGFLRTYVGKTAAGSELPTYTSTTVIAASDNLEVAIGKLDERVDQLGHPTLTPGVTTITAVDTLLVDVAKMVRWMVHVQQGTSIRTYEIDATHDGTTGADATATDYSVYAKLKMNAAIPGLKVTVGLTGAGITQAMTLNVVATAGVDVSTTRAIVI